MGIGAVVPGVTVACGDFLEAGGAMVEGQVEGGGAVAALGIESCELRIES